MKFKEIEYVERKTNKIVIEDVPGEGFLKFLYYNPLGALPLNLLVKRKFLSSIYGRLMDKSSSKEKIKDFVNNYNIDMEESIKGIDEFVSFNDFFVRKLKSKARKIAEKPNEIASPADGKILVFDRISGMEKFFLKGQEFNLNEFFRDKELAKKYEGGVMAIVRLAPVDYHRFHFPLSGVVGKSNKIEGSYLSVSPYAIRKNFNIFCENKREYSELETDNFGSVILSEIGATMVGGIEQTYLAGTRVEKGDEKGYFYFGGSTCVLFFEKDKVAIDKDILENSKEGLETKIYMGERIGRSL